MTDTFNRNVNIILLGLTIVILFFVIAIFNRTGTNVGTVVENATEETIETAQIATARAEAYIRLAAIRTQLAAEYVGSEVAEEVADVRADLQVAYANASEEVREEWRELDQELEQVEENVREESADSVNGLQAVLENLEQDLRTEDQ